ncbi:MAG: hypothetical protein ACRENS_02505 [Candidatus Eiseniibacteriota bacterium]
MIPHWLFDRGARVLSLPLALMIALGTASCSKKNSPTSPGIPPRTYLMGFSAGGPGNDFNVELQAIQMWNTRADAAMFFSEPPWDSLLAGTRPDSLVMRNQLALANYYHGTGKKVVVLMDPGNGLNRASDSDQLVAAGRSIQEPAIRQLFYRYAVAMDTLLHPDYFGASAETNLIRSLSPAPLYQAVITIADTCTRVIRAVDPAVTLFSTVQVDWAWGHLGNGGSYAGVAQDRADFPFMQVLGLSSYPYFAYALPESIPADYYSRLVEGAPIPEIKIEGGWTSASLPANSITSSPDIQRRYFVREEEMLDQAHAVGWLTLGFTDLDLSAVPPQYQISIAPFASLGLVDINLTPKPALPVWDEAFKRPKQ